MIRPTNRRAIVAVTATAGLLAAACGGSAAAGHTRSQPASSPRPNSSAKLTILVPKNGQVIKGSVVHLRVSLTGARIVVPTTTHITPTQGHLHVFLDNRIISMNYGLTQVIPDVSPGQHALRVEFVASDHRPFNPRVFTGVVFEVKQ